MFGPNGEKLDKNPLKDRRVREALSIAINREAIVDRVMEGAAVPSGQFLPEGAFGYAPGLNPPKYDPARAKELLAEAGYPNGLRITLNSPNDRYVNDAKIIQAVGQMWNRIGVQTTVAPSPGPPMSRTPASRNSRPSCSAGAAARARRPIRCARRSRRWNPAKGSAPPIAAAIPTRRSTR